MNNTKPSAPASRKIPPKWQPPPAVAEMYEDLRRKVGPYMAKKLVLDHIERKGATDRSAAR